MIQLDYEDYEEEEDDEEASSAEDSEPREEDDDENTKTTQVAAIPTSKNAADALAEAVSKLDITGGESKKEATDGVGSMKDWPGAGRSLAGLQVRKGEGILDSVTTDPARAGISVGVH